MMNDDGLMRWRVVLLVLAVGCTKPNPRNCADGTCTDPTFPFCDVGGEVAGAPNTCIAVDCMPGTFAACRGADAITCNAQGTDFDVTQCERGCNDTGCKLCNPNETACTNGTVATCDASGTVVSQQACPLGCFEAEPRCRNIDPSNGLGRFLDMVPNPPDLVASSVTFETKAGTVQVAGSPIAVPSFTVSAFGNGAAIRVFVLNKVDITSAVIAGHGADSSPAPAFALVAKGSISLHGEILADQSSGVGVVNAGCAVGLGANFEEQGHQFVSVGGGGGGNATAGASGGDVSGNMTPTSGGGSGLSAGTPELVPLRGGCSGGWLDPPGQGSFGGGALQFSSATSIDIDATIDIRGQLGGDDFTAVGPDSVTGDIFGGGGAGGSVLVEAPVVTLGDNAKLLASGGDGAGCPSPTPSCSHGGLGAHATSAATRGVNITAPGPTQAMSGGGGGGLGRIRINTPDQSFTSSSSAVIDGLVSKGTLATR